MLSIGLTEMLIVGAVALVVVGPERLPHLFRDAGRWYGRIRRMADDLRRAFVLEADRQDAEERFSAMQARREEVKARRAEEAKRLANDLPDSQQAPPMVAPADADAAQGPAPTANPAQAPTADAAPVFDPNQHDPNEPHPAMLERMKQVDAQREEPTDD